jgi:hypothetical protein
VTLSQTHVKKRWCEILMRDRCVVCGVCARAGLQALFYSLLCPWPHARASAEQALRLGLPEARCHVPVQRPFFTGRAARAAVSAFPFFFPHLFLFLAQLHDADEPGARAARAVSQLRSVAALPLPALALLSPHVAALLSTPSWHARRVALQLFVPTAAALGPVMVRFTAMRVLPRVWAVVDRLAFRDVRVPCIAWLQR